MGRGSTNLTDLGNLDPVPAGRRCRGCGAALRGSHTAYVGGGRSVVVFRCPGCGLGYRGAERDAAADEVRRAREAGARRDRRAASGVAGRGRRRLDEGGPDNPVIDEETARRLRDQLGG